ncbi:MAG: GNAT family N-acetyltransferase [Senegalia sp. (in: firmicutes)]|uniref:GNAT family N-acetyltransferase n=1 Tax=Bacillota TaxID=1239 RepID=UPI003F9DC7CF
MIKPFKIKKTKKEINISSPTNAEGWLGYCFNKNYWGKGYGTETERALVKYGFNKLNLHRIYATCDPENIGSLNILKKIGMKKEGHLIENKWQKGKWRDSYVYAILEYE